MRGPVDSVIDEVIANVQGRGIMLPEEPIARRVLERDGKIWVSLGPQSPHVVEIAGDGWIIAAKAPGLFLAADNAATWPMPAFSRGQVRIATGAECQGERIDLPAVGVTIRGAGPGPGRKSRNTHEQQALHGSQPRG